MKRPRLPYIILTLALLLIEVLIGMFVKNSFIRGSIGDVLVVIPIYTFIRIIFPTGIRLLPLWVFAFACLTEFLQYINIVELLGWQNNRFLRIVAGSVFDWFDIISYGIGCLIIVAAEMIFRKSLRKQ